MMIKKSTPTCRVAEDTRVQSHINTATIITISLNDTNTLAVKSYLNQHRRRGAPNRRCTWAMFLGVGQWGRGPSYLRAVRHHRCRWSPRSCHSKPIAPVKNRRQVAPMWLILQHKYAVVFLLQFTFFTAVCFYDRALSFLINSMRLGYTWTINVRHSSRARDITYRFVSL